jgi:hypothetical protein
MKYQNEKAIEILSSTPRTLRSLLGNLSDEWTLEPNNTDTWCAFDILGHYIHGEKTDWIPRAKIILAQGENIKFVPFDRFAQFEVSKAKTLNQMLDQFDDLRNKNIESLRKMNPTHEQLQLKGIHPELGEVTLEQLLATWVVHDLTHIRQIVIELAKKYSDNVGNWKEYLTILQ